MIPGLKYTAVILSSVKTRTHFCRYSAIHCLYFTARFITLILFAGSPKSASIASEISARITALPPPSALMTTPEISGFTSFSITGDWLFPSSTVLSDWFSSLMTRELPELLPPVSYTHLTLPTN